MLTSVEADLEVAKIIGAGGRRCDHSSADVVLAPEVIDDGMWREAAGRPADARDQYRR